MSATSARSSRSAASTRDEFKQMNRALQRLDRFWNDTIAYRM